MEILEAYCVELGRAIDIYEAQEAYFALQPRERRRFTFRCSDEACRDGRNPLVSGVNYDKDAEETEKYRQPHFRAPKGHIHLETCIWVQGHARKSSGPLPVIGSNEDGPRIERAKATNVVDVFDPKSFDPKSFDPSAAVPAAGGALASLPSRDPDTTDEVRGQPVRLREGLNRKSRLEPLIDCWSQLNADERREHRVVMGGRTLTYAQAVLHVMSIEPRENGCRVIQGGVRAKLWPEGHPTRLYLNFMDACDRFDAHHDNRSLTIELPLSRIRAYRGGGLMLHRLEQGMSPRYFLKAYAWGEIKPRDRKPGYLLEITSLDNLVLKAVRKRGS